MSSYLPPIQDVPVFDSYFFQYPYQTLNYADASSMFILKLGDNVPGLINFNGGITSTSINLNGILKYNGIDVELSLITGIVHGFIYSDKAVVPNINKDISGFRNIGSTGTITSNGLILNGMLSSTGNVINSSSTLQITGGSIPSVGNGIGLRFVAMASTGYLGSHNHYTGTMNNIDMGDSSIYIKSDKKVSINHTVPAYQLDVNGEIFSNSNIYTITQADFDDSTKCATTEFVQNELEARGNVRYAPTGFENQTDCTLVYSASTRLTRLIPNTSFSVWVNGKRFTYTTTQSVYHDTTIGNWFIYFDTTGTLQASMTVPDYRTRAMVLTVYYRDGTHGLALNERHQTEMDPSTHMYLHNQFGTYYVSGLSLYNYVLDGSADSDNRFYVNTGIISDENLNATISAGGASYTIAYMDNDQAQWTWLLGQPNPFLYGTYIQYNKLTGSTWSLADITNSQYVCYWLVFIPGISPNTQRVLIMGQTVHNNLASAFAETVSQLNLSSLSVQEYLIRYKIIFSGQASLTTNGKCNIAHIEKLVGTKVSLTTVTSNSHNALSGLDMAGAGITYGHINDTTQTIAGLKTFSSDISCSSNWVNGSTILMDNTGLLQTVNQSNITGLGTLTTLNLNGSFDFDTNVNTTMNNNLIITGSASSPSTTNGMGFAFNPLISTGRIKAYNYILSQFNAIDINEGAIYIKADKSIGIGTTTPLSLLNMHQGSSTSKTFRISYSDSKFVNLWSSDGGRLNIDRGFSCKAHIDVDCTGYGGGAVLNMLHPTLTMDFPYYLDITLGKAKTADECALISYISAPTAIDRTLALGHWGSTPTVSITKQCVGINHARPAFNIQMYNTSASDTQRIALCCEANPYTSAGTVPFVGLGSYGTSYLHLMADSLHRFYTNSKNMSNGDVRFTIGVSSSRFYTNLGIGTAPSYPLHVVGKISATSSTNYRYGSYSAWGGQITSTALDVSIYCDGRIYVGGGEIDIASDRRVKKDIVELRDEYCDRLLNVTPVEYIRKRTNKKELGFIAQDLLHNGLVDAVSCNDLVDDKEGYLVDDVDNNGIISHKGVEYAIKYIELIPVMLNLIKRMNERICELEESIISL